MKDNLRKNEQYSSRKVFALENRMDGLKNENLDLKSQINDLTKEKKQNNYQLDDYFNNKQKEIEELENEIKKIMNKF